MGVFGDWAGKYHDLGINVIPIVEEKKPPADFAFKRWLTEKQTEQEIESLVNAYGHCPGIGVICGPVSGISGFDFDYKFDAGKMPSEINEKKYLIDFNRIDSVFKKHLPDWSLAKKAKHGWTVFYKWDPSHYTMGVDRYKVRLFDFKATGYIVIPPSFHSFQDGKSIQYSWICGDPMDDFRSLPDLNISLIEDFREGFGIKTKSLGGRHGELFKYAAELVRIESDDKVIAQKMIAYDLAKHKNDKKGPYFEDKNHVSGDKIVFALNWIRRIRSFVETRASNEKPKNMSKNAWDHFIESVVGEIKKDVLSKKLFFRKTQKSDWAMVDGIEKVLRSYAKTMGFSKGDVPDEVARYCFEKVDETFLCEIDKWDNTDHLMAVSKAIISPVFNQLEIRDILLHWGTGVFSRINTEGGSQNRCLILKGGQGLGKDYFVRELLKSFRPYYEQISPPDQKKDWFEVVSRIYVAHIEEFDQTGNTSVALLKSLITQESVFFRESYGKAPTQSKTAVSFISTVNPDNFFRDSTGNRRYIVVPVEDIDRSYPKGLSRQIIAQFKDEYDRNGHFELSSEIERKIKSIIDALTPDRTDVEIEQMWASRAKAVIDQRLKSSARSEENIMLLDQDAASPIISDIARFTDVKQKTVRNILKTKGYQRRTGDGRFWAPNPQVSYNRSDEKNVTSCH